MTYAEEKAAGYTDGRESYQRGYVSRKVNIDALPVLTASGNLKGAPYVLLPAYNTSQYCIRRYLIAPKD